MPVCEKCWTEYRRRQLSGEYDLTYSEVVAQVEASGHVCTPAEQCGEMHLVIEMRDGGKRCRCGKVVARDPDAGIAEGRGQWE